MLKKPQVENYEIVKAAKVTFKEWLKRDFRLLVREELTTDENAVLLEKHLLLVLIIIT